MTTCKKYWIKSDGTRVYTPSIHPLVEEMLTCATELIHKHDPDGFLAMYWLTRWVEKAPPLYKTTGSGVAYPDIVGFRKHFNDIELKETHTETNSVRAIKKVYRMVVIQLPSNSQKWRGMYDEKDTKLIMKKQNIY